MNTRPASTTRAPTAAETATVIVSASWSEEEEEEAWVLGRAGREETLALGGGMVGWGGG